MYGLQDISYTAEGGTSDEREEEEGQVNSWKSAFRVNALYLICTHTLQSMLCTYLKIAEFH